MRLPHHLLRHSSGVFHFRLVVPADLRAAIGLRIIKKSLRTRDPAVARMWAYVLGARYAQAFASVRQRMPMDKARKDRPRPVVLPTGPGNEVLDYACQVGNVRIEANGPEDHARAMEAVREMAALMAQQPPALVPPPVVLPVGPTPPAHRLSRPIGKATEQWLRSIRADTLKKTLTIKTAAVEGFAKHFGADRMLHEVAREDIHAWVEALRLSGLQTPTLVNKCSYLRGFFDWAAQAGYYPKFPKDENPAMGHVVFRKREKVKRRAHGFKAFTLEQIQKLYAPEAIAQLSDGARWGALVGLYAGARVSEVGQLALTDFTTVDGVPCLSITDDGEGQSIKNEASRRTIPIHPDLLALGLTERVEALRAEGETRLFPKVKVGAVNGAGNWLSKSFTRHIEAVGIEQPAKGKYGFHSLRKTAIQTMKSAKVPLEWRCAYVGHELDEEHVEAYSGDYGPKEMLDAVQGGLGWALDLSGIRKALWSGGGRRRVRGK
jgi:integrase